MAKKTTLTAHIGSTFEKAFMLKNKTDNFITIDPNMVPWCQIRDDDVVVADSITNGGDIQAINCFLGEKNGTIIVRIESSALATMGAGSYECGIVLIQPETATDPRTNKRILEFTLKIREGVPR